MAIFVIHKASASLFVTDLHSSLTLITFRITKCDRRGLKIFLDHYMWIAFAL